MQLRCIFTTENRTRDFISGYVSPAKISSDKGELQAINTVPSDISSDKTSDNNDFQAINKTSSDKTLEMTSEYQAFLWSQLGMRTII